MPVRPLNLLLVDDDEDDFVVTRELLEEITTFQCNLVWVNNGAAALQRLTAESFDLCLIDYRLGELTGLEVLQSARAQGRITPVILLTGQDEHDFGERARQAGAVAYLVKGKVTAAQPAEAICDAVPVCNDSSNAPMTDAAH